MAWLLRDDGCVGDGPQRAAIGKEGNAVREPVDTVFVVRVGGEERKWVDFEIGRERGVKAVGS